MTGVGVGRESDLLGQKPVLLPLCPPPIPHDLLLKETQFFTVRSERVTFVGVGYTGLHHTLLARVH